MKKKTYLLTEEGVVRGEGQGQPIYLQISSRNSKSKCITLYNTTVTEAWNLIMFGIKKEQNKIQENTQVIVVDKLTGQSFSLPETDLPAVVVLKKIEEKLKEIT